MFTVYLFIENYLILWNFFNACFHSKVEVTYYKKAVYVWGKVLMNDEFGCVFVWAVCKWCFKSLVWKKCVWLPCECKCVSVNVPVCLCVWVFVWVLVWVFVCLRGRWSLGGLDSGFTSSHTSQINSNTNSNTHPSSHPHTHSHTNTWKSTHPCIAKNNTFSLIMDQRLFSQHPNLSFWFRRMTSLATQVQTYETGLPMASRTLTPPHTPT